MLCSRICRLSLFRVHDVLLRLDVGDLNLNDGQSCWLFAFRAARKKLSNFLWGQFMNDVTYPTPLSAGCRLASGVWLADWSDVAELTEESDDRTSETGATPSELNISSRSLQIKFCHFRFNFQQIFLTFVCLFPAQLHQISHLPSPFVPSPSFDDLFHLEALEASPFFFPTQLFGPF